MTIAEHFENYFEPEPNSGCWLWTAAINQHGYGVLRVLGKNMLAHRFSYEKYISAIPKEMDILHNCDMPCCVNPYHLRIGTHQDNMADKMHRGRHRYGQGKRWTKDNLPYGSNLGVKGELNATHKLTGKQVIAIRLDSRSQRCIAKDYQVSWQLIGSIKRKEKWAWLC